jgi:N-acyl-L-homoserine lactone synthetase
MNRHGRRRASPSRAPGYCIVLATTKPRELTSAGVNGRNAEIRLEFRQNRKLFNEINGAQLVSSSIRLCDFQQPKPPIFRGCVLSGCNQKSSPPNDLGEMAVNATIRPLTVRVARRADNEPLAKRTFHLRKVVFIDRLGWRLKTVDGEEVDQFDRADTEYCALESAGNLLGCFRARRCDRPYLTKEVFGHLATIAPLPTNASAWEITRFAMNPEYAASPGLLHAALFLFGAQRRAKSLVALADLVHERLLRVAGIASRRYGPPQIVGYARGRPLYAVVGEIPLAAESCRFFDRHRELLKRVELIDETSAQRPRTLSA